MATLLAELAHDGTGVLCAEHDPLVLGGLDRCLVLDQGRMVIDDVPGRALASRVLDPIGLTAPTLVRLAEAAGLDPAAAFDEPAIAAALRGRGLGALALSAGPTEDALGDWTPAAGARHRSGSPSSGSAIATRVASRRSRA